MPNHAAVRNNLTPALLLLIILIPRLLNLDVFLTPDEPLFLQHAREFAAGLSSGDYRQTLGIGYPGVTLAWWAAPVVGLAQTELGAYVAGRAMTALVVVALLLLLYHLAGRWLGRRPALWGVGLLALDPFTLGYSRLLHIEMPLALFMTLAGLSLLLWLRDNHWRWLMLTGLCTGLALLTKSTALLLGPMLVALLAGVECQGSSVKCQAARGPSALSNVRFYVLRFTLYALRLMAGLTVAALVAALTFTALWPAMWTQPSEALQLTFGKLLTDQEAGAGNLGMFWLGRFVEDPGPFFYPLAFILKATPWLLLGLGLSLWQTVAPVIRPQKDQTHSPLPASHSLPLWLFALTYLILMTIASKKSIRYLLPVFPVFYLLAGLAFAQISEPASQRMGEWRNRIVLPPPLGVPVVRSLAPLLLCLLFTLFYHPYYFTYYNPLLLGWLWAPRTLLVGWGEGLDRAAHYLNAKPPGTVAAWYDSLFSLFYHGPVQAPLTANLLTADHAVLYLNQVQRDIPDPNLVRYFRTRRRPEYTVRLNGLEYAWVYPGPVVGPRPDPAPQNVLGGDFGGEVRLLGYDLTQPVLSGQPFIVTLYWRVLAPPPAERYAYLRLIDAQGQVWAKADSPPVLGLWPFSRWQPNDLIEDAQEVPIPPGTPPGTYRLEVGWYDPATGQPLQATGQAPGQGGGLLLGEVTVQWQALTAQPDLPHLTDTRLAPNAHLVGYDSPPAAAATGQVLPLRLAWREAAPLFDFFAMANDNVMFEWRQNEQPVAEQLDPLPLPISRWGADALLRSQHAVIVPAALASGRYELVVMLHTGSAPAGDAFSLGEIEVTAPPHGFDLPAAHRLPSGPAQLAGGVALAGYELQPAEQPLQLTLYWQTESPLTTRYKVFAQLLTRDNAVAAQSDSFPAAGERPSTGWLPGEIITDAHTLTFATPPVPGTYRLIAGLYNPLTGQRVPLRQGQGDAILVAQVAWPP